MSEAGDEFESSLPANRLDALRSLVGRTVVAVTRYSWLPPAEAAAEYGLRPDEVFTLTAGPVTVEVDSGLVVGFASQSSQGSVTCWVERDAGGRWADDRLDLDGELHPVSVDDAVYAPASLRGVVGARVARLAVATCAPVDPDWGTRPRDSVRLETDAGHVVWFSYGLHDGTDDFSVVEPRQIPEPLRVALTDTLTIQPGGTL